jgi:hypothetical protein
MAEQNTRLAQEANTSQKRTSDEAIKAMYKMISKYNGVIRKIIETIEPVKGPWSTRKSVDQSTISYYAQVLKGVIEPLKHLMFQLSKTNDDELASMTTMIDNMIKMIDMAPPFSMIDSAAYKQGTYDYTGLSDDISIGSLGDYINLLNVRLKTLRNTRDKYDDREMIKDYLKNIPEQRRKEMKEYVDRNFKEVDAIIDKTVEELVKAREMRKNKLTSFEVNNQLVQDLVDSDDKLNSMLLPKNKYKPEELSATISELNKVKSGMNNKSKRAEIRSNIKTLEGQIAALEKIRSESEKQEFKNPSQQKEYGEYLNELRRLQKEVTKMEVDAGVEQGSGAGIDVNSVQQYNTMGRPVSNDQKINNDMINANRNWQIKNNPPHDTPIGNLNPFLAQDDASKYTYEVLLAKENAVYHPEVNALGANISLLQGPITNMSGSGKKSKAMDKIEKIAIDEKNDMHKPMEMGDKGYIPEEKEDQFKLPDLKPKKRK